MHRAQLFEIMNSPSRRGNRPGHSSSTSPTALAEAAEATATPLHPYIGTSAAAAWSSLPRELLERILSHVVYDNSQGQYQTALPTDTNNLREFLYALRPHCRFLAAAALTCHAWAEAARWVDLPGLLGTPKKMRLACLPGTKQRFAGVRWVDGWGFTDDDLLLLRPLQKLEILRLCGRPDRQLSDTSIPTLGVFSRLTSLSLGFWGDTTEVIAASTLSQLSNLTSLDLAYSEAVTDNVLLALRPLTALQTLDLTFCHNFSGDGLAVLSSTTRISKLLLSRCYQLTESSLTHLQHLEGLTDLDLNSCFSIGDAGLWHLQDLPLLTSLDLGSCLQVTDDGVYALRSLTRLTSLSLEGCEMVTFLGLDSLATSCRQLETLNLSSWRAVHAPDLASIASLSFLTSLCLGDSKDGWGRLKDFDFAHLSRLTNLTKLEILDCKGSNGSGLRHLPHSLRHLVLAGIKDLQPMYLFCASFIPLISLEVRCDHVGDMGFDAMRFLTSLPSLRVHCRQGSVSDAGLQGLLELSSLQELHLQGDRLGPKITAAELDSVLYTLAAFHSLTEVTLEALEIRRTDMQLSSAVLEHLRAPL